MYVVLSASLLSDFSSACDLMPWDAMVIHTFGIRIDDRFGKLSPDTPFIVISSPNVDFIPYFDDSPNGTCRILRDGRYGRYDFTLHPQEFYWPYSHNCVCPRKISDKTHPFFPCWTTPDYSEFKILEGSAFSYPQLGKFSERKLAELCALADYLSPKVLDFRRCHGKLRFPLFNGFWCAIKDLLARIQRCNHTFKDLVLLWAEFGRLCLDTYSFIEWHNVYLPRCCDPDLRCPVPADTTLMGAFTTDPLVVQKLGKAGVPVWHIRTQADITKDTKICSVLKDTPPFPHFSSDWPAEDGGPCPVVHIGPPTPISQQVVKNFGHVCQDAVSVQHTQAKPHCPDGPTERPVQSRRLPAFATRKNLGGPAPVNGRLSFRSGSCADYCSQHR
jgi:hypothetical protein